MRTEPANTIRTIEPSPEGLDLAEPATLEEEPELNLTWDPVDEDEDDEDEDEEDAEWNKVLAGEDS